MKPRGFRNFISVLPVACLTAGCAVGPNYHHPAPPAVTGYTAAPLPGQTSAAGHGVLNGQPQTFVSGGDIAGDWWALYRSPALNRLIAAGIANSPTLAAAQQTLIEAEENLRAEQGFFFPSISGNFQAERERISSASSSSFAGGAASGLSTGSISPFTLYDASLSATYTLDVFGGVRRQVEGLTAQAEYERWELEASYLSLTANIVTAAVNEASLNAQIASTREVIAADQHTLTILQRQVALGGIAQADVLNQQATLDAAVATLPPLQSQLSRARHQLAAYVGAFPADFDEADFTLADLHLPQTLPVSLPSALVAQRPDVAAAAAQLHEASAQVGVATANMLPNIALSADVGHEALSAAKLFTPSTLMWSLVGAITQPIFEGGTLEARRKSSVAALRVAADQYQNTVVTAFQNVADSLTSLQADADALAAAAAAADAAGKSLTVTQDQYHLGAQPFTAVLTAENTYQNALVTRARDEATRLADTAALFQSLGGGWWHRQDVTPAAQACCGLIP